MWCAPRCALPTDLGSAHDANAFYCMLLCPEGLSEFLVGQGGRHPAGQKLLVRYGIVYTVLRTYCAVQGLAGGGAGHTFALWPLPVNKLTG